MTGEHTTTDTATSMQPLVLTEEQRALSDITGRFLADRMPSEVVRTLMATPTAFDQAHWDAIAEMGWPAMAIPERHGGAGYGWTETAVVFEQLGRAVAALPLLATTMGTVALVDFGTATQQDVHLPAIAAGTWRPTVALPVAGTTGGVSHANGTLTGTATHVIEAASADAVVVADDDAAWLVPLGRAGVTTTAMDALDPTRPLGIVDFDDVTVGDDDRLVGAVDEVVQRVRTVAAVMLANESVGVAAGAHAMAVEHATTRRQFGRAIGSFQAIKHMLADDLVCLEAARSAAWHAARALDAGDPHEIAVATPLAASLCSEAAVQVTADVIQVHGGIGFTWEHDAHLYYKRANASRALLGSPRAWRRQLAEVLGL